MPLLHTLSREVLRMILEHIPERKRVQVLLTCKDLAKLLAERRVAAQAAFDGLAAELANEDKDDWSESLIVYNEMHREERGTRYINYHVNLQDTGIVHIKISTFFRIDTCRDHIAWTEVNEFYPWFKMWAKRIDDELGVVEGALVRSCIVE